MKTGTIVIALLFTVIASSIAFAADATKVTLNAQDMKLDKAVAELSKQAGVQIICDTGVKGTVNGSFSDIDIEALLDIVTKSNGLKWQKLFFPAQAEKKPTLEDIKKQAQAISAAADMPLVVYDPVTKKQSVFVKQTADAPVVSPEKLGLKPLYLISMPEAAKVAEKTEAKSSDEAYNKYQEIENERIKAFMGLSPEQRVAAIQQEMMSQMGMDPAVRAQIMKDEFTARHNMAPGMRDQYRQMMRDTFRQLRDQGVIPEHDRGPRGDRGNNGGDRSNRSDHGSRSGANR